MVAANQSLFKWHADNRVFPNEKLRSEDAKRVGILFNTTVIGGWSMHLIGNIRQSQKQAIPIGGKVKLDDGGQILLQKGIGGRLLAANGRIIFNSK